MGSIFRTADAVGVSKIFLTGITPTPIDRFGRVRKSIQKTSLGATEYIPWEQMQFIEELLKQLKEDDVSLVSIEQDPGSIDYRTYTQTKDTAYIFGGEVEGVREDIRRASDAIIEVPMFGKKESLNVAVTAGIVLYQVRRDV